MRIYHYTTINNLALILASKKIRFNRLDNVDDLEESFYKSGTDANKINITSVHLNPLTFGFAY